MNSKGVHTVSAINTSMIIYSRQDVRAFTEEYKSILKHFNNINKKMYKLSVRLYEYCTSIDIQIFNCYLIRIIVLKNYIWKATMKNQN